MLPQVTLNRRNYVVQQFQNRVCAGRFDVDINRYFGETPLAMSTEEGQTRLGSVEPRPRQLRVSQLLRDAANAAVILGVVFAVVQITVTARTERVRLAIDAAAPTHSKDFLDSYSKLLDAYRADHDMVGADSLRDDLLFVMNVYDGVAVLYLDGLLDNEILEKRLFDGMGSIVPVLDAMKWPSGNRFRFDAALKRMGTRVKSQEQKQP